MRRPVVDVLFDALPNTLVLRRSRWWRDMSRGSRVAQARIAGSLRDRVIGAVAMFFYAMPDFWLALMVMLAFDIGFRSFPWQALSIQSCTNI